MRKIAVLDQNTIDKIAAGEVVERPSSVVKELVENAIDAGATAVTVEIADGGKKLIRITDNGSGMEAEQIPLAFLRHATSKIEKVEDLEHIASLGFRGEALSSIAAVSQVELITKTPSSVSGSRYVIEGGQEHSLEELGAPEGTTFLVRNLFYNTPARSKFLKSDMTEANYIHTLMEQLALSHPEISFKYIQNKQVKLHTSGNYSVKDVIYSVYGREIARALLEVSQENSFMKIEGFVGKPEIARGNRSFENYYINGRYVKNNIITKAIENAYRGFLMQHKFPFVSLRMEMEGNDLDVNVHPAKREVRFAREQEVYDAVYDTVRAALTKREMIPKVSVDSSSAKEEKAEKVSRAEVPEPFEQKRRAELYGVQKPALSAERKPVVKEPTAPYRSTFSKDEEKMFSGTLRENQKLDEEKKLAERQTVPKLPENFLEKVKEKVNTEGEKAEQQDKSKSEEQTVSVQKIEETVLRETGQSEKKAVQPEIPEMLEEKAEQPEEIPVKEEQAPPQQLELFEEKLLVPESRSRIELIGQIFDTYWLVQFEDNFYIIDQHAAHEKVYYERMVKQFREHSIDSQYLNPPLIVTLSMQEEEILKSNLNYFEQFGFEIENFGGREYRISAVPSNLYGLTEEELFLEMLDNLASNNSKDTLDIFAARLATMACKAAVKGNHAMSPQEAEKLIDELLTLENPYHCPHGRPTIISMTRTELEKKFKRIV
ncbi:DNA mismatch repair endonuclease MutL [Blautia sp. MSJ-19]|uniref:DNA mismatch repair endonuclease MutL n=1 Tax=Blautia sp. MSJ-19 TaxID=2841517 RepID=UPI001C0EB93B|nr:DNA mismatch repair endonuclease MutL [Blautia sp. MSJ-19]MBU5481507.1 DNA mismatch repair endonuclease MutL [Blautia sp. MSJ-19]